jgi:hypothetical protein
LAQHGFAEETGEGRGRERPWRCVAEGTSMSEPYEDVPTKAAARALSEMYFDRYISRLRQARAHFDDLDPEWRAHQADVESLIWVTPEELGELNEAILALALKYRDRLTDPARRPIGARPVELLYFAHNAELTSLGGKAEPADQPSNRSSKAAKPRSKTAR